MEAEQQIEKMAEVAQKESDILAWEASEFRSYEHNWKWYVAILVASLGVIGYSVYSKDWFMIAVVVLVNVFLFFFAKKQPKTIQYRITQLGLYAGDHFYSYNEIHSFWLSLKDREKRLNLIFMKKYLPQLTILLDNVDSLQIKTVLGKYIPEQENRSDSLIDLLARILKLQ